MPPKVEASGRAVFADGINLGRKDIMLIASSDEHVLGWRLCSSENSYTWSALTLRIVVSELAASDGGDGVVKALGEAWSKTRCQKCVSHVFS